MQSLKMALLQRLPRKMLDENLEKRLAYCRRAKQQGADLALFPEMWSVGYRISEEIDALKNSAIPADGPFTEIYLADFPLEEIRDYRRREVQGNAYRRPQKYHLLVEETGSPPFLRSDARR